MAGGKTKKTLLKNKAPVPTPTTEVINSAITSAGKIRQGLRRTLKFKQILNDMDDQKVAELKDYIEHNKTNSMKKIEHIADYTSGVSAMIQLRDHLDEMIQSAQDTIHDIVIKDCSKKDDFRIDYVLAQVENEMGKREERSSGSTPMDTR